MARNIKHVGQLINSQRRVIVVFREIPDEPTHCLVVDTDALPDWMHNDIINAVESPGAQSSANFYEYAQRTVFTDGSNMLQTLHAAKRLSKQPTSNVMMTPNTSAKIRLDELNNLIREQNGDQPAVTDVPPENELGMATKKTPSKSEAPAVISEEDIAKNMLAQAEQFSAEAERLREEAYALSPGLKKSTRGRKKAVATTE